MFTGIVQALGSVRLLENGLLIVDAPEAWPNDPWQIGESISVNGCCLTLVATEPGLTFDLSDETLRRTSLQRLKLGSKVNLERAMRAGDRFGGHIVQGHVDAVGSVAEIKPVEQGYEVFFDIPTEYDRYLIDKGSITIDGISLTVNEPANGRLWIAVIPHTWKVTTFGTAAVGDPVNLEFDVLAKHVEKLIQSRA